MYAIRSYYEQVRLSALSVEAPVLSQLAGILGVAANLLVITSYSIHYTKLYDDSLNGFLQEPGRIFYDFLFIRNALNNFEDGRIGK